MKLPEHIAIIMDGNGRWAKKRNLPRTMGHRAGQKAAEKIIEECAKKGIKALTFYTFSTENWNRPVKEVNALMKLLEDNLDRGTAKLNEGNIRINFIGKIDDLPGSLAGKMKKAMKNTENNTGMLLTFAINYGGRQEIFDAVKKVCKRVKEKKGQSESIGIDDFSKFLYTADMPDPDLIIRTSGEMRVSNFLIWQGAYSEFYFTDTLWPDFNKKELNKAIEEYSRRERRFGG